jgi:secernin
MCDTIVAVPPATRDGAVWFGKNSDREPGEAQLVEHLPSARYSAPLTLRCTHAEIPQATRTFEVVISRPFWMWGAEMGANERGVVIGNEAVFTRLPVASAGLTGMDLLRLALERASSAREALDLITHLIARHGQGGACGYRHKNFRYHNSFIIADAGEAWVLETAGPFWAAQKARGVRTISNVLTIGREFDLISDGAFEHARKQGWCRAANDFDFARCYGEPRYRRLSGGDVRRACTLRRLTQSLQSGGVGRDDFFAALRDHNGARPAGGWRMTMPCAHASWWPTRQSGQTTGSMVSRLDARRSVHYLTGTSSPCLSVFKPVVTGEGLAHAGPPAGAGYDAESLFWRHERLHRAALKSYGACRALFEADRAALEAEFLLSAASSPEARQACWERHRQIVPEWAARVERGAKGRATHSAFGRYWMRQAALDQVGSP